ncbi:STAS domain-containing protein [Nonomuraea sp. NPDC000554]|uniref:STAS domain-containing protein n=1 Tax=Nonomuraea sp. NPDC000554 TaxID=3154259 RepID=UPI00331BE534
MSHITTPAFEVRARRHDHCVELRLAGELDLLQAPLVQQAVDQFMTETGLPVLLVDVTRLTFCDSSGIHVFVRAHQRAQREHRQVILAGAGGHLERVLAVLHLDAYLDLRRSPQEVLDHLVRSGSTR